MSVRIIQSFPKTSLEISSDRVLTITQVDESGNKSVITIPLLFIEEFFEEIHYVIDDFVTDGFPMPDDCNEEIHDFGSSCPSEQDV